AAAESVAEQLAAELLDEGITPLRQQVVSQAVETFKLRSVHSFHPRIDGPVAQVFVASPADGVEAFQREAERVDALMADCALGVCSVLRHQLPDGQSFCGGLVFGQARHVFWRTRQAFAE